MMFVHLHLLALTATGRDVRVMLAIVTFSGNDYFLLSIALLLQQLQTVFW